MTIELRTLGQITLRDDNGVELRNLLTQPKRLALLVYLASGAGDGRMHRRDALLAMFWPDSDDERARNSLRQAVHFIKQVAGSEMFASQGADELGLTPGAIALDTAELEALATSGKHEDALAFYNGEFLEGFTLRGAPAFERWVQSERARLRKRVADSAWAVAEQRLALGDTSGAHEVGARALAMSADNETAVRRFIALLVDNGDRAAALSVYQRFEEQLAREFGAAPSPETRALVETLAPARTMPAETRAPVSRPRSRWAAALVVGVAAIVIAVTVKVLMPDLGRADPSSDPNRIVVLPFVVRGAESLRYLEDGLPILLGTRLDGAGALRTVDARALIVYLGDDRRAAPIDPARATAVATRFGAQLYVLGSIVGRGDKLRFVASLYDRANGADPVAHTEVEGAESDLVTLVDKLASELLAARFQVSGGGIAETAARTTSSLPALKAWLAGEAAITSGRYGPAMVSLREAIAADSAFAMAHFRLAVAADWSGNPALAFGEAERAVSLSEHMSPSSRRVLLAFRDMKLGNYASAARTLRAVVSEQPSATEAWYELGESLFHGNPSQGLPLVAAQDAFDAALRLNPLNFSAAIHLARIAAAQRDTARLDRVSRAALDSNPDQAQRSEVFLLRALSLGDASARREFLALPASFAQLDALWRASGYSGNLDDAYVIADSIRRVASTQELRTGLHMLQANLAMGRERFDESAHHIDSLVPWAPQSAAVMRLLLAMHPRQSVEARRSLLPRALAVAGRLPTQSGGRQIYLGALANDSVDVHGQAVIALARMAIGDTVAARRMVATAVTGLVERVTRVHLMLLLAGSDAVVRREALREVAQLDSLSASRYTAQSVFAPRVLYHMTVSQALEAEGQVAEAYARLAAVPEDFGFDVAYLRELQRRRDALRVRVDRAAQRPR